MCGMMFCKQMRISYVRLALLRERLINNIKMEPRLSFEQRKAILKWHWRTKKVLEVQRQWRYYHRDVRAYLDDNITGHLIGRKCPIEFPPHSPDLTPLYFYLWGTLKNAVHRRPATLAEFWEEVEAACALIAKDTFANFARTVVQRTQKCVDAMVGIFNNCCNCRNCKSLRCLVLIIFTFERIRSEGSIAIVKKSDFDFSLFLILHHSHSLKICSRKNVCVCVCLSIADRRA